MTRLLNSYYIREILFAKLIFTDIMVFQTDRNPHLETMKEDVLYHLGFSTKTFDFKEKFGDTKIVIVSGSSGRVRNLAEQLTKSLNITDPIDNLTASGGRYDMYKVGPVLIATHGIGIPSMSIVVHELIKLIRYAECKDVVFIRMGTSGGLGLDVGTIVVTSEAVNGKLQPVFEQCILGKQVERPTEVDAKLSNELVNLANEMQIPVTLGKTMCANDFYEEQSRLDGAFCEFKPDERLQFLKFAHESGVRNFEMESLGFASLCHRAGIPAAIICVVIVNRLNGDQVKFEPGQLEKVEMTPSKLLIELVKRRCLV